LYRQLVPGRARRALFRVIGPAAFLSGVRKLRDYSRLRADLRVHDTTGDDLGLIEHPAPNVEPGDVVVLDDGREALVTARVETDDGDVAALLEVAIAPPPLTTDDGIA